MKTLFKLIVLLLLFQTTTSHAQLIGGRENGQQAPSEAKAAELSAGGVSGDVNLFNGTFAISYSLGAVSTPGGVTYSASMSYSSSFAAGDNLPQTSGIPYGEGWNLDIPMISISSEDYNQYDLEEMIAMTNPPGFNEQAEDIPFNDLRAEGQLMWFSPMLNIPGVASGRLVYKYTDKYQGRKRAVFVLHKFERYIEARFDGRIWEVLLDDGTVYEFSVRKANQRNANNRRTYHDADNMSAIASQIIPKVEVNSWYIKKIYHPNKYGSIYFTYDTFGKFDMFKEFKQSLMASAITSLFGNSGVSSPRLTDNVCRDIFLREIDAGTEKLVFDYRSLFNHGIPNLYEVNDPNITRYDSLYSSKVVASWGNSATSFSNGWQRYKHLKGDIPYNSVGQTTSYSISATNPYEGTKTNLRALPHLYREAVNNTASFEHGFLESPLFGQSLPPGDMYEIRTNINEGYSNYDINIVSGSTTIPDKYVVNAGTSAANLSSTPGTHDLPHAPVWQAQRGAGIYSTFNQAIKWNPELNATGSLQTSNYFTMPNLPFDGMRIQIGPGNSDIDYSIENVGVPPTLGGPPFSPNPCVAYISDQIPFIQTKLPNGHNVPPSFGIGMPWEMTALLYAEAGSSLDYCGFNGNTQPNYNPALTGFWWNNSTVDPSISGIYWDNSPTQSGSAELQNVELIRHAKNPYMLHQVRHLKLNGIDNSSGTNFEDGWQLTSKLQFQYDHTRVKLFANYTTDGAFMQTEWRGQYRNIILLKNISQLPIRNATQSALDYPTTHFEYDSIYVSNGNGILNSDAFDFGQVNTNIALLSKITNPLGKETSITYNETPLSINSFFHNRRPESYPSWSSKYRDGFTIYDGNSDGFLNVVDTIPRKMATPYASTLNFLVTNKSITDADGVREWDYTYENLKVFNDYPPMPKNISWDRHYKTKYGYSQTTVTAPELVSGNRPYTKYYHHNIPDSIDAVDIQLGKPFSLTERQDMLWSKLYKVEQYDADGNLITKTETAYDYQKAFVRGSQRVRHERDFMAYGNYQEGHDYIDMIIPNYAAPSTVDIYNVTFPTALADITSADATALNNYYYDQSLPVPDPVDTLLIQFWTLWYTDVLIPYYNEGIADGYGFDGSQRPPNITQWTKTLYPFYEQYADDSIAYERAIERYEAYGDAFNQAYDIWNANNYLYEPDFTASIPGVQGLSWYSGMTPYEMDYESTILQWHPYHLDSYFIKTISTTETAYDNTCANNIDSIQTITEFEYYDADETGATNSEGYDILKKGVTDWQQLQWEPSWQLYKKKSYSPQHPDAYTSSEYFYYYDMMNQEHVSIDMTYGLMRDLQNLDDGNDGLFYPVHWSWKYKMRNIAFQERVTSKAPGQDAVSQSTYLTYSNEWNNVEFDALQLETDTISICDPSNTGPTDPNAPQGCGPPQGGNCGNPPAGFITFIDTDGTCFWCWAGPEQESQDSTRLYIDLGFPHKDNLFYQATQIQTNETIQNTYQSISDDKYAILRFVQDVNNTNTFLPDFPYPILKTHEVSERNMYGAVQLETDEKGLKTRYEYSGIKNKDYLICKDSVQFIWGVTIMDLVNVPISITTGVGLDDSLKTRYVYHNDYTIDSIIDPNDKVFSYDYDKYGRLKNSKRNGQKTGAIEYHQWNNDHNKSFENRMLDNYVETRTYNEVGGNESVIARAYVDPLGRSAITATHKASTSSELIVAGGIDYDNWDRQTKLYKPYLYNSGFNSLTYNMHQDQPNLDFAENQYEDTPRSRVLKSAKYGIDINTSSHTVDNAYCLINGDQAANELDLSVAEKSLLLPGTPSDYRLMRTQLTDEDGKTAIEYTNTIGQKIATLGNTDTTIIVTLFVYDSRGQLVKVINPEKQESTYLYNLLGQLCEKTTVDGGTTSYVYNTSGQVIIEQDAKAALAGAARFYDYDEFGRPTAQTYYSTSALQQTSIMANLDGAQLIGWMGNGGTSDPGAISGFIPEKRFFYGNEFNANDASISQTAQDKLSALDNQIGQLSHTISYDLQGNPIDYRFMSYNENGWLDWEITQFNAEGISAASQGSTTIIDLPDYNLQGSLKTQNIDLNGDGLDFQYHYTYDDFNRLNEVYISYNDDKQQGYKVASYTYNDALGLVDEVKYYASGDDGALKNKEIDVITHTYDIRDRLTQLDAGLFNWKMFYDDDNAAGNEAWNGNIHTTEATYKLTGTTNAADLNKFNNTSKYAYTYDGLNRLTAANAAGFAGNIGDATYAYDEIGNLTDLSRITKEGTTLYNYEYLSGTNRLLRVESGPDRYTYDANGNMLTDTKKELTNTEYGRANLPQQLSVGTDTTIHYLYDVNDMRIYKKLDSAATIIIKEEYYLRDATGRELAIMNSQGEISWYIYGKERVASVAHQPPARLDSLFISGTIPDSLHYAKFVGSDGTVQPLDSVIFHADSLICLEKGFNTPTDAGFVAEIQTNSQIPKLTYYLYDHLGNTRVTYSVEVLGANNISYTTESAMDYFPYGKALRSFGKERYLSTQHERDTETDFDYRGARFYDSDVARFNSLDPLAADFAAWSPYNYVLGNPVVLVDPDGRNPILRVLKAAKKTYKSGKRLVKAVRGGKAKEGIKTFVVDELKSNAIDVLMPGASDAKDLISIGKGTKRLVVEGIETLTKNTDSAAKQLLPGELDVGLHKDLISAGKKGDNITPHHIPSANHMKQNGISKNDAVSINMEQPFPGKGGRHRETFTYGTDADANMSSRDALAAGVKDTKQIYQKDGLYDGNTREALQKLIQQNKETYPDIFKKQQ